MSKHTPGPWTAEKFGGVLGGRFHELKRGRVRDQVAMATGSERISDEERNANTQLIAASPDLLEACKSSQCSCSVAERDSGHKSDCWFPKMEAAISKAEGITE